MEYIKCIKNDEHEKKEYFKVGKLYPILDYIENGGVLTSDEDNHNHYLSGEYFVKYFRIKVSEEIKKRIICYLECDETECMNESDAFYEFYYKCMVSGMDFADADRYAILNTLFNYDIGIDNARVIDTWMYEHNEEIYELKAINKADKQLLVSAVAELGLNIDFSGWLKEDYKEYSFFEG